MVEVSVVLDHVVGPGAGLAGLHLSGHAGSYSSLVEPVALDDPGDSPFERRGDENGPIYQTVIPSFEEQRDDVHDELAWGGTTLALDR